MLFELALGAAVAAVRAAGDTAGRGQAGNAADVARSDRIWAWATGRWGERFLAEAAARIFPAAC